MAEEQAPETAPAAAATPKKGKSTAAKPKATKSPKAKVENKVAAHPSSSVMVVEAIAKLAEKGGSSLQAIKKSIADTHKDVDVENQSTYIKKALKKLVETGKLTQPKGKGAAGSFKLAVKPKVAKKPTGEEKSKTKKAAGSPTKAKKPAAKKAAVTKPKKSPAKAKAPKKAAKPLQRRNQQQLQR